MKRYLFALPAVLLVTVSFISCGGKKSNVPADQGASVYNSTCKPCHGSDGKQGVSGARDLSISTLGMDEKINIITNGRGVMPGYKGTLSEEEIRAVAEYTATLKK